MQRIRTALRRWLGAFALAFTLLFAGGARAGDAEPGPAGIIDDSTATVGQYYAILCNTCASTSDYINKAVTQYPRVRESMVYVYNLASAQIRTIALNWDPEANVQTGGYEVATDSRLVAYVSYAGDLYRRNGNSLSFTAVIRADGSVYLKLIGGGTVDLRASSARTTPRSVAQPSTGNGLLAQVTPGRNSPIDLRGYLFGPYFDRVYPNFPDSSYDLAFGDQPGSIDSFVYDYFTTLSQQGSGQVFDPDSLRFVDGSSRLTEQVAGTVTVFIPMKDGGYAKVRYDTATADVLLRQVVDPSGVVLPNGHGNALQFYGNRSWSLGSNAYWAVESFEDWAVRNGISVLVLNSTWTQGGNVTCRSRTVNEVTCTILPN
ncbi:MAG: hypothetical protein JNN30_05245 [Rhodanobacteraceae bacterium]|nr:hypothetical protein [Rhodanobacteraceae bacterium]